jgi:hypothetical protein
MIGRYNLIGEKSMHTIREDTIRIPFMVLYFEVKF